MNVDTPTDKSLPSSNSKLQKTVSWDNDISISELMEDLFLHMITKKNLSDGTIDMTDESPECKNPKEGTLTDTKIIWHRGVVADIPLAKLFKSFILTLKKADPSLILLPFMSTKQHYSSISTLKQIQILDEQKIQQFFKPYHQRQHYSLSGYFHVSSDLSFQELQCLPSVEEWLDSYRYYLRIHPSQNEEMIQTGALCYSSVFIFCDQLKQAISSHPLFTPTDPDLHVIKDLF